MDIIIIICGNGEVKEKQQWKVVTLTDYRFGTGFT